MICQRPANSYKNNKSLSCEKNLQIYFVQLRSREISRACISEYSFFVLFFECNFVLYVQYKAGIPVLASNILAVVCMYCKVQVHRFL